MLYRVTHETEYAYAELVAISHSVLRLRPRDLPQSPGTTGGRWQRVRQSDLTINPWPAVASFREDYFGNQTTFATVQQPHDRIRFTNVSQVEVVAADAIRPRGAQGLFDCGPAGVYRGWEQLRDALRDDRSTDGLDAYQFVFDSPLVAPAEKFAAYAQPSFTPAKPLADAARDLMGRVFHDFKYDPATTTVTTPLDQAFEQRSGVCQDFAHVFIACLRSLGLPARYVSGYLRTFRDPAADPQLVGADASHAWASVWCGDLGWVDFDPTNNQLPGVGAEHHVTVAWGRDYSDVSPVQGMILGGGEHEVTVRVSVEPIEG